MKTIYNRLSFICSLIILSFLLTGTLFAQMNAQLQQPPPNQLRAADLWKLTIINSTGSVQQVKIFGTLDKAGEGIVVQGTSPMLSINPGAKIIGYNDVKNGSVTFSSNAWRDVFTRTGNAPSGDYTICVNIKDGSGNVLASDCITQNIVISSTVDLMQPVDNAVLHIKNPTFSWMPLTPPAASVTYKIKIVEIIGSQTPDNAMLANSSWYEKPSITTTSFVYPLTAPNLDTTKKYAWQIFAFQSNTVVSSSEIRQFKIGNIPGSTPPSNPPGNNPPVNNPPVYTTIACTTPPGTAVVSNQTPSTRTAANFVNIYVKLGLFYMKVLTASGTSTALTGTGSVVVNWLKTPIAVQFKNIKVNTLDELYSGEVITQMDQSAAVWPQQWLINGAGNFSWGLNQVKKLNNWLHDNSLANKLVKDMDLNTMVQTYTNVPLKLPLGVNDANGYTIAISEMKFEPTTAKLNCLAIFPVNEYNDSVGFKASDIVFSPSGPSAQSGKLGLIDDITFIGNVPNGDTYSVVFKKVVGTTGGTYITWDCEGFKELVIDLDFLFPRTWLKPIPDNGTAKTTCNIRTSIVNWNDWIIKAQLPLSSVNGVKGMELKVDTIYYDHSLVRNPDSIFFPANYPTGATTGPDFMGFYISKANVKMPDNFKTSNQSVNIQIKDFIINKNGVTGKLLAKNIFTFPNGNISKLGASLDTVKMELVCSSITSLYARGKIVLPVSENLSSNGLSYKAVFIPDSGFSFLIQPQGPVSAKFFSDAKLTLKPTSYISLKNLSDFDMNLNGNFKWDNINIGPVKNVKFDMDFEDVGLTYKDSANTSSCTFRKGDWSFASPPKFLANFPVSIKNIKPQTPTKQGNEIIRGGLSFSIIVNLDEKIGGSCGLTVLGAIEKDPATGKYIPKFDPSWGVKIDTIKLYANLSAVKMDGKIAFFHDHVMYGNGFDGTIKVTVNSIKTEFNSTVRMGTTTYQNNGQPFRYWYVDGKVLLPKEYGIAFMSGLAFYGFGAGVWKHMDVGAVPQLNLNNLQNATTISNTPSSGATFTPNKNIGLGLKVLAVIGTYPEPKAFNSDASISAQFSTSGGLNKLVFNFDFWCLTELTKRNEATILGNANVEYVPPTKLFSLTSWAKIDRSPVSTAGVGNPNDRVSLALKIDGKTSKWYFICGTPAQPNKLKVLGVTAWEYILVGNDINQFVKLGFQPSTIAGLNSVGATVPNIYTTVPSNASTGKGFSFGVGVNFDNPKQKVIASLPRGDVLLRYGAGGGFEVNLSLLQYPSTAACGTTSPIGFKSWYAQGGVAAWFRGYVKVSVPKKSEICLVCCGSSGYCDYNFIDVKLGASVLAGFPNPVWAVGNGHVDVNIADLITWSGNVDCNYNTPCIPVMPPDNQTYTAEDATQQIGDMIIHIDTPPLTERFDPGDKIGVSLGFTPNEAFDIGERQTDGSILTRTFQVRYTATLTRLANAPLNSQQNNNTITTLQPGGNLQILNNGGIGNGTGSGGGLTPGGGTINNVGNLGNGGTIGNIGTPGNLLNLGNVPFNTPIALTRSNLPNNIGNYDFYTSGMTLANPRNLLDTTRYRITVTAQLWSIVPGTNNTWEKAKTKTGAFITETSSAMFNTGIYQPQQLNVIIQPNGYQPRLNNNNPPIVLGGGH